MLFKEETSLEPYTFAPAECALAVVLAGVTPLNGTFVPLVKPEYVTGVPKVVRDVY